MTTAASVDRGEGGARKKYGGRGEGRRTVTYQSCFLMKLLRVPSSDVCEREQVLSALQECVHFEAAPTDTFDTASSSLKNVTNASRRHWPLALSRFIPVH